MKRRRPYAPINGAGIRVVVADDQALFCAGLERLFREAPPIKRVASATQFDEAVELVRRLSPDVVLVAPKLSHAGPFETARRFHSDHRPSAVIFLDDSVRELNVRAAVDGGVRGYWTKQVSFAALLGAVGKVATGGTSFCPAAGQFVRQTRHGLRFEPSPQSTLLSLLTRREMEVLLHLAEGFSVKECALQLGLSASTVDNHKSRAMKKLRVHKTVDLILLAGREKLLD